MNKTAAQILEGVRARHLQKSAASPDAVDPNANKPATVVEDPGMNSGVDTKPPRAKNPEDTTGQDATDKSGPGVHSLGEGVPAVGTGTVTSSPSSPSETKAANVLDRLRNVGTPKQAAATPAAQPAAQSAAAQPEPNALDPKKAGNATDFSESVLAKMASIALSTEEGIGIMTELLEKAAGAEETRKILAEAVTYAAHFTKQAAEEEQVAMEEAAFAHAMACEFDALTKDASASDVDTLRLLTKLTLKIEALPPELKKYAAAGMVDATAMMGEGDAGGPIGDLPGAGPEEPLGPEQIIEVISSALESGELTKEEVKPIIDELMAQVDGGGQAADPDDAELEAALAGA